MKRLLLALVVLTSFAVLLVPSVAAASTWKVKDRAGHSRGTVANSGGLFQGDVKHRDGSWAGWISSSDSGSGHVYGVYKGVPRTVIGNPLAYVENGLLHPGTGTPKVLGKVVRANGRWRVFKRVKGGFRRIGSVPGACSRGYAMGAARLLLW